MFILIVIVEKFRAIFRIYSTYISRFECVFFYNYYINEQLDTNQLLIEQYSVENFASMQNSILAIFRVYRSFASINLGNFHYFYSRGHRWRSCEQENTIEPLSNNVFESFFISLQIDVHTKQTCYFFFNETLFENSVGTIWSR